MPSSPRIVTFPLAKDQVAEYFAPSYQYDREVSYSAPSRIACQRRRLTLIVLSTSSLPQNAVRWTKTLGLDGFSFMTRRCSFTVFMSSDRPLHMQRSQSVGKRPLKNGAGWCATNDAGGWQVLGSRTSQPIRHSHHSMKPQAMIELPPSHVDSPLYAKWIAIVEQMEAEGCDTSDAQSIADIEVANSN